MKSDSEIYIEIRRIGNVAKVTAIHAATGVEASISGPANADPEILQQNAVAKLRYVLKKQYCDGNKFTEN